MSYKDFLGGAQKVYYYKSLDTKEPNLLLCTKVTYIWSHEGIFSHAYIHMCNVVTKLTSKHNFAFTIWKIWHKLMM